MQPPGLQRCKIRKRTSTHAEAGQQNCSSSTCRRCTVSSKAALPVLLVLAFPVLQCGAEDIVNYTAGHVGFYCTLDFFTALYNNDGPQNYTTRYNGIASAEACQDLCTDVGAECVGVTYGYENEFLGQCILCIGTDLTDFNSCCFTTYIKEIETTQSSTSTSRSSSTSGMTNTTSTSTTTSTSSNTIVSSSTLSERSSTSTTASTSPRPWCASSPTLLASIPNGDVFHYEASDLKIVFAEEARIGSQGLISIYVADSGGGAMAFERVYNISLDAMCNSHDTAPQSPCVQLVHGGRLLEVYPAGRDANGAGLLWLEPQKEYRADLPLGALRASCEIYAVLSCFRSQVTYSATIGFLGSLVADSAFACQRLCYNTTECGHFTFTVGDGSCSMFNASAEAVGFAGSGAVISGPGSCHRSHGMGLHDVFIPVVAGTQLADVAGQDGSGTLTSMAAFEIAFDVIVHGLAASSTSRSSLVRLKEVGDDDSYMPGLYLAADTRQLEIRMGSGDSVAECTVPSAYAFPDGASIRVRARYSDGILAVDLLGDFGGGEVFVEACALTVSSYGANAALEAWVGDSMYQPANASIANLVYIERNLGLDPIVVGIDDQGPVLQKAYARDLPSARTYVTGPTLQRMPYASHCSVWKGSAETARNRCDNTPGCEAILDNGCEGSDSNWRFCSSSLADMFAAELTDSTVANSCTMGLESLRLARFGNSEAEVSVFEQLSCQPVGIASPTYVADTRSDCTVTIATSSATCSACTGAPDCVELSGDNSDLSAQLGGQDVKRVIITCTGSITPASSEPKIDLIFNKALSSAPGPVAVYRTPLSSGAPQLLAATASPTGLVVLTFDTFVHPGSGEMQLYEDGRRYTWGEVVEVDATYVADKVILAATIGPITMSSSVYVMSTDPGPVQSGTGNAFSGALDSSSVMTALASGHTPEVIHSTFEDYQCLPSGTLPSLELYINTFLVNSVGAGFVRLFRCPSSGCPSTITDATQVWFAITSMVSPSVSNAPPKVTLDLSSAAFSLVGGTKYAFVIDAGLIEGADGRVTASSTSTSSSTSTTATSSSSTSTMSSTSSPSSTTVSSTSTSSPSSTTVSTTSTSTSTSTTASTTSTSTQTGTTVSTTSTSITSNSTTSTSVSSTSSHTSVSSTSTSVSSSSTSTSTTSTTVTSPSTTSTTSSSLPDRIWREGPDISSFALTDLCTQTPGGSLAEAQAACREDKNCLVVASEDCHSSWVTCEGKTMAELVDYSSASILVCTYQLILTTTTSTSTSTSSSSITSQTSTTSTSFSSSSTSKTTSTSSITSITTTTSTVTSTSSTSSSTSTSSTSTSTVSSVSSSSSSSTTTSTSSTSTSTSSSQSSTSSTSTTTFTTSTSSSTSTQTSSATSTSSSSSSSTTTSTSSTSTSTTSSPSSSTSSSTTTSTSSTSTSSSTSTTSSTSSSSSSSTSSSTTTSTSSTSTSSSTTSSTSSSSSSSTSSSTTTSTSSTSTSSSTTSSTSSSSSSSTTTSTTTSTSSTSTSTSTTSSTASSESSSSSSSTSTSTASTASSVSSSSSSSTTTSTSSTSSTSTSAPAARRLADEVASNEGRRLGGASEQIVLEFDVCGFSTSAPSVATVDAGHIDVYGYTYSVVLDAGAVIDAAVGSEHSSTANVAEANATVELSLASDGFWDYPSSLRVASSTTLRLSFPYAAGYGSTGTLDLQGVEISSSELIFDDTYAYIFPPRQLGPGSVCGSATAGAFVSAATGTAMTVPDICLEVPFWTSSTSTSTSRSSVTSVSTKTSKTTSSTRVVTSSTSTVSSTSVTTTTSTSITSTSTSWSTSSTSSSSSEIPMCNSSLTSGGVVNTDCNGLVLVGTVCQVETCPENSTLIGTFTCSQSEYMVGASYCLTNSLNTSDFETLSASLRMRLDLSQDVTLDELRSSVTNGLLAALGISRSELIQLIVVINGVVYVPLRRLDASSIVAGAGAAEAAKDSPPSLRHSRRQTELILFDSVEMSATVFFETFVPADAAATSFEELVSNISRQGTAASNTFTAELATVGGATSTVESINEQQAPAVVVQTLGTDASGEPLLRDADGNGIVDESDAITSTTTSSSSSASVFELILGTFTTTAPPGPVDQGGSGGGDDDDNTTWLVLVAAVAGGLILLAVVTFCCFKAYKERFTLEEI